MIYLDNAATSYPKPESVWRAADRAARLWGGNPGRSGHRLANRAAQIVYDCREAVAGLFEASPEAVVFTSNATGALNLAIASLAKPGDEVLISNIEHNAVLRPVHRLTNGRYRTFDALGDSNTVEQRFLAALTPQTALVVCAHVSNLCGLTLPIERIGRICYERGIRLIVDASQSAGHLPVSIAATYADAICAPGHKGLYGLMGSGFAVFADRYVENARVLRPFVCGGNGVNSRERTMPDFLAERLEAGTLPMPALAALSEGIREVRRIGLTTIAAKEEACGRYLCDAFASMPGVSLYGVRYGGGTVLFSLDGMASEEVAEALDRSGICVRAGLHCCPLGHETLGTPSDGAVRVSVSYFTHRRDLDALIDAVAKILRER